MVKVVSTCTYICTSTPCYCINWSYSTTIQTPLWWQHGRWLSILFCRDTEKVLNSGIALWNAACVAKDLSDHYLAPFLKSTCCIYCQLINQLKWSLSRQNQFKLITAHFTFMGTVYLKVKDQFVCVCQFDNSTKDWVLLFLFFFVFKSVGHQLVTFVEI